MLQSTLTNYMVEEGVARYRKDIESAKKREEESGTKYGQRLLSAAIVPFADAIAKWRTDAATAPARRRLAALKPLQKVTAEVAAFISTRVVLDAIGASRPYGPLCLAVGRAIEDEVRFAWLKKNQPGLFKTLDKQLTYCNSYEHKRTVIVHAMNKAGLSVKAKEDVFEAWTPNLCVQVGATLVDLLKDTTLLVQVVTIRRGKKLESLVQATEKTTEWIRSFNAYAEVLDPMWLPTVDAPTPWTAPKGGGYTGDLLPSLPLVKRPSADYLNRILPAAKMDEALECINALQNTAWCINRRVYGVMQHLWDAGRKVGSMPQSEDEPLPTKPLDIETNADARKAWRTQAARVHNNNAALRSNRLHARKLLNLAQKFANVEKFYFPYQMDFRGRLYTVPTFLTPQGNDLARGLLLFADTATIRDDHDAYWLGIYGANLFGKDKITFEERLAWVHSQRENILAVAADPLANQWWQTAEEPWQFLAWCLEWSGWLTKGPGFQTSLPVCLDGTNNGLQILSMLTRDEIAAKATNVLPSASPADIYGDVAKRVVEIMQADFTPENAEHNDYWLSFGINRKTTKRPVMVLPYGGTFHSCRDYVADWYVETLKARNEPVPEFKVVASRCHYLALRIWEGIEFCVGRPRQAMVWLQECAALFTDANLPILWTAPSGFPVLQAYKELKAFRVETTLGDRVQKIQLNSDTGVKLSRARQRNGISPNYVHSLDAAALCKTVSLCSKQGLTSFAMIHDSYGTLAPRVHDMAAALRVAFVQIFSVDQLDALRTELQAQLDAAGVKDKDGNPVILPPVPAPGGLDVRQLLDSEFFFA